MSAISIKPVVRTVTRAVAQASLLQGNNKDPQEKLIEIVQKLEAHRGKYIIFSDFDKKDLEFYRTAEIPKLDLRERILKAIIRDGVKETDVAKAFGSNPNLFADNRCKKIFLTDIIARSSVEGTAVQKSMCKNETLIPDGNSGEDSILRERVAEYIMDPSNRDKKSAEWLALNPGLFKNPRYGDYSLRCWAEADSSNMETTIAVNIIENLRLQQKRLQELNEASNGVSDSTPPEEAKTKKIFESILKIIDRIKDDPKGPKGALLSKGDRLILMSHSDSLIGMQGEAEKFIFELMQNPNMVNKSSWGTMINKANFYFINNSDHSFLLGLALNEQKNQIEDFRQGLLLLAVKYPYTEFAKKVLSGLTEFDPETLKFVSALLKHNPDLKFVLKGNENYRMAKKLKTPE